MFSAYSVQLAEKVLLEAGQRATALAACQRVVSPFPTLLSIILSNPTSGRLADIR